jgi:hypothetical protein
MRDDFCRHTETKRFQANFRQTNVATKVKITYVKDGFLDVSSFPFCSKTLCLLFAGQNPVQGLCVGISEKMGRQY